MPPDHGPVRFANVGRSTCQASTSMTLTQSCFRSPAGTSEAIASRTSGPIGAQTGSTANRSRATDPPLAADSADIRRCQLAARWPLVPRVRSQFREVDPQPPAAQPDVVPLQPSFGSGGRPAGRPRSATTHLLADPRIHRLSQEISGPFNGPQPLTNRPAPGQRFLPRGCAKCRPEIANPTTSRCRPAAGATVHQTSSVPWAPETKPGKNTVRCPRN